MCSVAATRPTSEDLAMVESGTVARMKSTRLEDYRGRWVAVTAEGDVVADAEDMDAIMDLVKERGLSVYAVHGVPEADEPMIIGLG